MQVNGETVGVELLMDKGYVKMGQFWNPGDVVSLDLAMPIERVEAHPAVRKDAGRVALQRGPLIYCLEEVDNGPNLPDLALPRDAPLEAEYDENLLGGVVVITGEAQRRALKGWEARLYRPVQSTVRTAPFKAVPYYAWANRAPGEMLVWIREV